MRTRTIPLVLAAACIPANAHAQDEWVREAPNPYPMQSVNDMAFMDSLHGYMVGFGDVPLETHDGGRTWAPGTVPGEGSNCVFAYDSQHAWMFGDRGLRTTDGGQTWEDLGFLTAYETKFLSTEFGWISDGYAAQVTHDGGESWLPAIIGGERVVYPDFANEQIGIGEDATFDGGIWRTSDGGESWSQVFAGDITNVAFVNETVALAVGDGRIYRSTDAGLTWTDAGPGFGAYPQIIVFDQSHVIVNAQNAYKRSDDAGLTWASMAAPDGNLKEVWVRNGPDAFAVTNNGEILHSTDAFLTWQSIYPPTHIGLDDMEFLPDGAIVAAGPAQIVRSEDAAAWEIVSSGVMQTVIDVEMFDAQRGLALANGGYVLRTTDGGEQWVPSRPSYVLGGGWNYCNDVFILDEHIAYVAGGDGPGPMIKTTDGGETWQSMSYPLTTQIESIWFVDEQHGWIGRGYTTGWIYRTADGGATWEEVWPQSFGGIWDIQFHDLNLGWALRGGSYILRTTDGGDNWSEISLPGFGNYIEFHFIDANIGYIVGDSGKVAKTTNGGLSWQELSSGTGEHLQDLEVVSAQEVWAVGGNNERIHTTDGGLTWQSLPVTGIELPGFQAWYAMDISDDGAMRVAGNVGWIVRSGGGSTIPGDLDGDGSVGFNDLIILLAAWGPCAPPPAECLADIDGDGTVGFSDLITLLSAWGTS